MEGLTCYAGGAQADSRRAVDSLVLQDDQVRPGDSALIHSLTVWYLCRFGGVEVQRKIQFRLLPSHAPTWSSAAVHVPCSTAGR